MIQINGFIIDFLWLFGNSLNNHAELSSLNKIEGPQSDAIYRKELKRNRRYIFKLLALFCFIVLGFSVHAETIIINGNAAGYANTPLVLFKYKNYITKNEVIVASDTVTSNGDFELKFESGEVIEVFMHLGIYRCFLYAEPGKSYTVILPKRKDKQQSQKFNPFFKETHVHMTIKNFKEEELNFNIRTFDQSYYPYYNKHVFDVFSRHDFSHLDSAVKTLKEPYIDVDLPYLQDYIKYKLARLRYLAYQRKSKNISDEFFLNQPVKYNNVGYMELFNRVYDDYFIYYGRTEKGKKIYTDISENKSLLDLKETLRQDEVLANDTLEEIVILKNLHDEFYGDMFSRSAILAVLDSISRQSKIEMHVEMAKDIMKKITRLLPGYDPPAFQLFDKDSNLVSLKDFEGKYVYLNFCSCQSYACITEFQTIDQFNQRHKDHLEIVTIVADDKFTTMTRFLKRYPFDWTFLHYGNQNELIKEYDIRAFPTYFLIGPDGKLLLSPSPGPNEGFGEQLFKIMRERGDI